MSPSHCSTWNPTPPPLLSLKHMHWSCVKKKAINHLTAFMCPELLIARVAHVPPACHPNH
ncbi:rCG26621 [Rattus norvegicus]|uniref:RCG26621 n=1 Tax=Rattus norvegicus TaxID=10116 RepID=A6HNV8_RAT|nr:rCG26621 [Rattus norvegicus]